MPGVANNWFSHERLNDHLYRIYEPHYRAFSRANIWLVRGRERYLLIDTGLGVASLRQYLEPLLDKPLMVVATHVHFDHAGGCHEFADVRIHAAEQPALRTGDQAQMLSLPEQQFIPQADFTALPFADFDACAYRVTPCPQARAVQHGAVIDLGDRAFEVLHLPGHSPGSIGLYDARNDWLFSGDVVYDGELLDTLDASVIDDYIDSMRKLLTLPVAAVYPGHYQVLGRAELRRLVAAYLHSKQAPLCPAAAARPPH